MRFGVGLVVLALLANTGCGVVAPPLADTPVVSGISGDPQRFSRQKALRLRVTTCTAMTNGSGFLIDNTTVITNAHVVADWREAAITTWNGFEATVNDVWVHSDSDIAVLHLNDPIPDAAASSVSGIADPEIGAEVLVPGYPGGGRFVLRQAEIVEQLDGSDIGEKHVVYSISAAVEQGSSGGPVLDGDGQLVAIVFGFDPASKQALAIEASVLNQLNEQQAPWVALPETECTTATK